MTAGAVSGGPLPENPGNPTLSYSDLSYLLKPIFSLLLIYRHKLDELAKIIEAGITPDNSHYRDIAQNLAGRAKDPRLSRQKNIREKFRNRSVISR